MEKISDYHINTSPLKREGKKLPQYIAALSVCLGALAAGGVLGWTGNISEDLKSQPFNGITIDDTSLGWIGSIANLGAACGCIPIGILCDFIGRRKTMLSLTIPFMLGWMLILFAQTHSMLYIGRFLTGLAGCAFCVCAPIYTSEIAETDIRGALSSYFVLFLCIGIFLAYTLSMFLNMKVYTICIAALPILFAIVFFFQPESPVYTIKNNKESKAAKALTRLRGSKYDLNWEIQEIKQALLGESDSNTSTLDSIKKKATKKSAFICFSLMVLQQLCGINVIIFYTGTIFESTGVDLDARISTIIFGALQTAGVFLSTLVVDRLGRRILLITSNLVSGIAVSALAVFFTLQDRKLIDEGAISTLSFVPIVSLSVYIIAFTFGMSSLPWVLSAELFPPEINSFAVGCVGTVSWLMAFVVTKFYFNLQSAVGSDVTFYMFALMGWLSAVFVYFFVPETKGKTLAEIQRKLNE